MHHHHHPGSSNQPAFTRVAIAFAVTFLVAVVGNLLGGCGDNAQMKGSAGKGTAGAATSRDDADAKAEGRVITGFELCLLAGKKTVCTSTAGDDDKQKALKIDDDSQVSVRIRVFGKDRSASLRDGDDDEDDDASDSTDDSSVLRAASLTVGTTTVSGSGDGASGESSSSSSETTTTTTSTTGVGGMIVGRYPGWWGPGWANWCGASGWYPEECWAKCYAGYYACPYMVGAVPGQTVTETTESSSASSDSENSASDSAAGDVEGAGISPILADKKTRTSDPLDFDSKKPIGLLPTAAALDGFSDSAPLRTLKICIGSSEEDTVCTKAVGADDQDTSKPVDLSGGSLVVSAQAAP